MPSDVTNHKPIIRGDDDGIWRRLVVIPFDQKFTGNNCDPHLEEKLSKERDAILTWMVEGCLKWQKEGMKLSPRIQAECQEYRSENDLLGQFIADKCITGNTQQVEQKILFIRWQFWCGENGIKSGTSNSFSRRLRERGLSTRKSNSKTYLMGIT